MSVRPTSFEQNGARATDPFEWLLMVSHEGICVLDAAGVCRGISSAGAHLLGYLPHELNGMSFHTLVHASSEGRPANCPLCGPSIERFEGRERLVRKDGTAVETVCTATAINTDSGADGRLIVFAPAPNVRDEPRYLPGGAGTHTEAKLRRVIAELAAEKQRTESVHAFARQLFVTPLGDLDRTLVDQFCLITDSTLGLLYKADEPEGDLELAASHRVFRSGVSDSIPRAVGSVGAALSAREPVVEDHSSSPLELAGRRIRHILYVPLWEGDEDLGVLILARAATRPYSRQEQESVASLADLASIALANTRVVARLERLSQLTRAALDGIVEAIRLFDPEGRELLQNASMRDLAPELGLDSYGARYGSEGAEFASQTTDPEGYMSELRELESDRERRSRIEWELAESGRLFERYSAPIRDSLGTFIGRVLVLRETTAERRAERLRADLISFVSHELRTPLTSMLGFTRVMLEDGVRNDIDWSSHVQTIQGEIVRLLGIVDDLLDVQNGTPGLPMRRRQFDLGELVRDQVSAYRSTSSIHELAVDPTLGRFVVEADQDLIAQVLSNLLSNAIKYSPSGGRVRVRTDSKGDAVRVTVSDQGIGIPEDQQAKVFRKFFRVESGDMAEIDGHGLGLALCREIMALHGGEIGFDSTPGKGATFWFELPAD